jgi:hypothetical protein
MRSMAESGGYRHSSRQISVRSLFNRLREALGRALPSPRKSISSSLVGDRQTGSGHTPSLLKNACR